MIDWFASKFAVLIAGLIIIPCIICAFNAQKENFEQMELQNIADTICCSVDTVVSLNSESITRITFNCSREGFHLPLRINEKDYEIELLQNSVAVSAGCAKRHSEFAKKVHLWCPGDMRYASEKSIKRADAYTKIITVFPGSDILIESKCIIPSNAIETFIYPEEASSVLGYANTFADAINSAGETNISALNITNVILAKYKMTFLRGIFLIEDNSSCTCCFVNSNYLWNPSEHGVSYQTTLAHINETDRDFGAGFELNPGEALYIERKIIELTDVDIGSQMHKVILATFLYK